MLRRIMLAAAVTLLAGAARAGDARDGGVDADAADALEAGRDASTPGDGASDVVPPIVAPRAAPIAPARPIEVVVTGAPSAVDRLRRSAEAVTVVDLRKARQQTSDLGEVLARAPGVAVRREGGLGSNTRFSLNGLYDDQVRFLLDGVPLDVAGFPLGVANVPVNLIDRVEIYRGVVPIRFGADALGGVVNLVTDQTLRPRLGASYQVGSFGTHRATVDGLYRHAPTGFLAGGTAFLDVARNDYLVDVRPWDDAGRLFSARVRRFHDAYQAYGGTLQVGLADRPRLRRLLLQGFATAYDKELQNNPVMSVPYGEARAGGAVYGGTARYDAALTRSLQLEVVGTYSRRSYSFVDASLWTYDWFGGRMLVPGKTSGEIVASLSDQVVWQDAGFGRVIATWTFAPAQLLRFSTTPVYTTRAGDDRLREGATLDRLNPRSSLLTIVTGLEIELNALGDRLSNITFVKDYVYRARGVDISYTATFPPLGRDSHTFGVGDSVRYRLSPSTLVKASYEYATRLPTVYEVFGDLALIEPNLELEPEVSHNVNVGPLVELKRPAVGRFVLEANAFYRDSRHLIVPVPLDRRVIHDNVFGARNVGVEAGGSWLPAGGRWSLDGMATWQDQRVSSDQGEYGRFEDERLPNRPYLFASWGARALFRRLPGADDRLEVFYNGRYVHSFFRSWEGLGQRDLKAVIPAQVTHNLGLTWVLQRDAGRLTTTFEVANVTDARVYDNFGAQRPGRAFYLKLTGEL